MTGGMAASSDAANQFVEPQYAIHRRQTNSATPGAGLFSNCVERIVKLSSITCFISASRSRICIKTYEDTNEDCRGASLQL